MAGKIDRRTFLQLSALSAPLVASKKSLTNGFNLPAGPIVISTWDSGMKVNEEPWKVLVNCCNKK